VDAAQILIQYCNNVDEAVTLLVTGEQWSECHRVCFLHKRMDLIETELLPQLCKSHERMLSKLKKRSTRFSEHFQRLRLVRHSKLKNPQQLIIRLVNQAVLKSDGQLHEILTGSGGAISGTASISEASAAGSLMSSASGSSFFSVPTSESSANTVGGSLTTPNGTISIVQAAEAKIRKEQKRLAHLKRSLQDRQKKKIKTGSLHEEEYLVAELKKRAPTEKHRKRVIELLHMLTKVSMLDRARALQSAYKSYLECVRSAEATGMAIPDSLTDDQKQAILTLWDWPNSMYDKQKQSNVRLTSLSQAEWGGQAFLD